MNSIPLWAAAGWLTFHVFALMAAWGTRIAAGPRLEAIGRLTFYFALAGVGLAAWISRSLDSVLWASSSIVLVAMVLLAVIDLRQPEAH